MFVAAILTRRLELVSLSPAFLLAACERRTSDAAQMVGARPPETWPGEAYGLFELRLEQVRAQPEQQPWLLRAMVERGPRRRVIGYINFHGPPDEHGRVEIGYTVLPTFRRRGYADEAARALIAWAREQPGVGTIVASIAPANAPSLALARRLGFVQTGRQWDERDGEELVFERPARLL